MQVTELVGRQTTDGRSAFREALKVLINAYSQEQDSNTPDFILARYLDNCLKAYEIAVNRRDRWYSTKLSPNSKVKET